MNRRTRPSHRSPPSRSEPYLKYLKPGALAQIRDSRMISARSHRTIAPSHQIRSSPPSSPPSTPGHSPSVVAAASAATMTAAAEGFLFFSGRVYGARCPQRKRLVAAKSAVLFPPMAASPVIIDVASDNPIIDVFGGGGDIAAH